MSNPIARTIVSAIIQDLAGRKGIGDEYGSLDEDTQQEIYQDWVVRVSAITGEIN